MSTSRSAIMGSENAAVAKVKIAKTDPAAEPISRNSSSVPSCPSSMGTNAFTIMPARDQSISTTSCTSANTPACPATRRARTKESRRLGTRPASSARLTQYRPTAINGATNTKPDSSAASSANRPNDHASADTATLTQRITKPNSRLSIGARLKSAQPSRSQRNGAQPSSVMQGTANGRSGGDGSVDCSGVTGPHKSQGPILSAPSHPIDLPWRRPMRPTKAYPASVTRCGGLQLGERRE